VNDVSRYYPGFQLTIAVSPSTIIGKPSGIGTLFALEEFSIVESTLSVFQRQSAILPPPFVTAFQPATSALFKQLSDGSACSRASPVRRDPASKQPV
ncbi:MAG TPA: hypothetical protein VFP18_03590, partial [Candidatus Binatia bacterium]|nr:hypothetical protein [Candidatus Binatia bacterium]